jgi:hypothetical protein
MYRTELLNRPNSRKVWSEESDRVLPHRLRPVDRS